ncbi:hypothetical protein G7Y79_00003g011060 [Physcia stellaris]|nr:hypothetical protein G7Y79_00003g011060 [Physcia stellaris]
MPPLAGMLPKDTSISQTSTRKCNRYLILAFPTPTSAFTNPQPHISPFYLPHCGTESAEIAYTGPPAAKSASSMTRTAKKSDTTSTTVSATPGLKARLRMRSRVMRAGGSFGGKWQW